MSTHDNEKNIAIEPEILERAIRQAKSEGKTVDELAEDAIKRHLALKTVERFRREGESHNKAEEEIEAIVDTAVQEYRKERSR